MKTIAILGTGNEIINGDILNTNAQFIAQSLISHQMQPGNHMVASDEDHDLQSAMHYMLEHHDALITIGGLGPTSDDLTRFALAKVINQSLKFDDASWNMITARLNKFNLAIPESNKQQCLFPQGASILINQNGTANGCKVSCNGKIIYMLPGPPNECLPMFEHEVLPDLVKRDFSNKLHRKSWLLLGVSEGSIAESLDELVKNTQVDIGYRVDYPYLEVKCQASDLKALKQVCDRIENQLQDCIVSHQRETASQQLVQWILHHRVSIHIDDPVTGGLLEMRLHSPDTASKLYFSDEPLGHIGMQVVLSGLRSYWTKDASVEVDQIDVTINHDGDVIQHAIAIPYRGKRMQGMACESICWYLLQQFKRIFDDNSDPLHQR